MDKDKQIIDQIADVVGKTTLHYEYKKEFFDPVNLAKWIESKKAEWQREARLETFTDIEKELFKHKFDTDMSGWEIVPKFVATMQLLRKKYITSPREGK